MLQNRNHELFSLLFNSHCIAEKQHILPPQYNFYEHGKFVRGYIPQSELHVFSAEQGVSDILRDCLLDVDFDFLLSIEEDICSVEKTNEIFYDGILKPGAWQLDKLDGREDGQYSFHKAKNEVDLYILDTGVNWKHKEFSEGQVIDMDPAYGIKNLSHPHGTGTASQSAGLNYGSSKGTKIYNYPVCRYGGSCGGGDIEAGLHAALERIKATKRRGVINMSLGSNAGADVSKNSIGQYFNALFKDITEAGGIVVVSAGNSNQDACSWLYSFSPYVISVGSIDKNYNKSGFSNFGDCVDIYAFGDAVPIAYSTIDNSNVGYKSGTSFSSPLVAGLVVNIIEENPSVSKDDILKILWRKVNSFLVPKYECAKEKIKCCQSSVKNSRLDLYCRNYDAKDCPKSCVILNC